MNKIKWFALIIFIATHFFSCAQTKQVVNKVYAFKTIQLPGNIQEGENENISDTVFFVYVETSEHIDWKKAYKNESCYEIKATPVNDHSLKVGTNSKDGKEVTIERSKDKNLWHLLLYQKTSCENLNKENEGKIMIEGFLNNKKLTQTINDIILLSKPPTL